MECQLISTASGRGPSPGSICGILFRSTLPGHSIWPTCSPVSPGSSHLGCPSWLNLQGGIALQILKACLGLSDEKLPDRLNTDWALQYFCGISLSPGTMIRDKDLVVGRWRCYVSKHIDCEPFQATLARHWKPLMHNTQMLLMGADQIYAANANRGVCTFQRIATSFVRKGPQAQATCCAGSNANHTVQAKSQCPGRRFWR